MHLFNQEIENFRRASLFDVKMHHRQEQIALSVGEHYTYSLKFTEK